MSGHITDMQNTILLNEGGPRNLGFTLQWLHCTRIAAHWGKRSSNSPRLASLSVWSILDSRALAKIIFIEIQRLPSTRSGKSRAILCQETPVDWQWSWLSSVWTEEFKMDLSHKKFDSRSDFYSVQCTICWTSWDIYVSKNSCLDISFNIYLSQLVRLEEEHDFWGNRDFQTLNLRYPGHFEWLWVFQ